MELKCPENENSWVKKKIKLKFKFIFRVCCKVNKSILNFLGGKRKRLPPPPAARLKKKSVLCKYGETQNKTIL